jgi:hypothetical protein
MRADLMVAGDKFGWADLTYAAAPLVWGQDIDVPEIMLNLTLLVSSMPTEGGATGDQAARMSTPGAVRSGCISSKQDLDTSRRVLNRSYGWKSLYKSSFQFLDHLENVWGDRVGSSGRKWYDIRCHDVLPCLTNQNSCYWVSVEGLNYFIRIMEKLC